MKPSWRSIQWPFFGGNWFYPAQTDTDIHTQVPRDNFVINRCYINRTEMNCSSAPSPRVHCLGCLRCFPVQSHMIRWPPACLADLHKSFKDLLISARSALVTSD